MASSSSNKLVFLAFLLLFVFSNNLVAGKPQKVKLNLYYESLCPYSQKFINDDLVKLFESDLKLVPFGNAKVSDNLTVTCQVLFNLFLSKGDSFSLVDHFFPNINV